MKSKELERLLADELAGIYPDFNKILNNINSTSLPTSTDYSPVQKSKRANGRFENVWNRRTYVAKRQPKVKIATAILSLCMCTLLVVVGMFSFGMFAINGDITIELDKRANSYVTVNINPEVELAVNKFNKITTATATNNSGKILLTQLYKELDVTTLVGQELNGALISIIDQAAKMGYIDVEANTLTNAIMIDVVGNNIAETNKKLLANEAKQYFVSKGIYAVVVTDYDSKHSLVEEAKKYNPNVTDNTPIADLISTVEGNNGGKDVYQQEIDRITADNASYQTYLDNSLIADVKMAADKRINDIEAFISKEKKIIAGYQEILSAHRAELVILQKDLADAETVLEKLNAEYQELLNGVDGIPAMQAVKQQLQDANREKAILERTIAEIDVQISNVKNDYDDKIDYLDSLIIERNNKIAELTASNIAIESELSKKNSEMTECEDQWSKHNIDLGNLNNLISSVGVEINSLTNDINLIKLDKEIADSNIKLGGMLNSYLSVNAGMRIIMEKYSSPNADKDNCIGCNERIAVYYVMNYLTTNNKLLYMLSEAKEDNFEARLDSVIEKALSVVVASTDYYTASEIGYNKGKDMKAVIALIKNAIWVESDMKDLTFWHLLINIKQACTTYDMMYGLESMVISSQTISDKKNYYTALSLELSNSIVSKTEVLKSKTSMLDGMNLEKASIESKLAELNKRIEDCNSEINDLNKQLSTNNFDIGNFYDDIEQAKADIISAEVSYENDNKVLQESKVKNATGINVIDDLIIELNKEIERIRGEYSYLLDDKKEELNVATHVVDKCRASVNVELIKQNTVMLDIEQTNLRIDGYNSLANDIKEFANSYCLGARIVLSDSKLAQEINNEIVAIEDNIKSKKDDSIQQMKDNIKSNLDKQAEYQYDKNIGKYEQHNTSLTEQEYITWEEEQLLIVKEIGWQAIYKDWLEKQN